ncbi:MAG TPA: hypothetical protein VNG29_00690 [Candidatus Paceibacterota bacterium]|nr:hypothetical protein [Candidatus Paceibacterota bacterium]
MKRVFVAIGAVAGFLGLAALFIFFIETTGGIGPALPVGSLAADLSARYSTSGAQPVQSNQLADIGAIANSDGTGATTATGVSTGISQIDTSASPPETQAATSTPTPDETATVSPPAPGPSPEQNPESTPVGRPDPGNIPVATTTITVTATAAPPLSRETPQKTPVAGGIPLPYRESNFSGDQNWQTTWGAVHTTWSGSLDLSTGAGSLGGAVYLKNVSNWTNYALNAALDWIGGNTFGLMADYNDASNYVLCEYIKTASDTVSMRLAEYLNGGEIFLSPETPVAWNGSGSNLAVTMSVNGIYGGCSFNGQSISSATIAPGYSGMSRPGSGSIGFVVHAPSPGTGQIIVKQVSVVGA